MSGRFGGGDGGSQDMPEEVRRALEQLPPGFRDALDKAPPEVKDALSGFQEGVRIEGMEGADLDSALAGTGIDPQDVLDRIPDAVAEQIEKGEVEQGPGVSFVSTEMTRPPARKFDIEFGREAYGPGDVVDGVIRVNERVKTKELKAELCYVEQSPNYAEQTAFDEATGLRSGTLEPGTEMPFVLRLPEPALPNWDPGGVVRALSGEPVNLTTFDTSEGLSSPDGDVPDRVALAGYGRLFWAVVVTGARRGVVSDHVERIPIPLGGDRSAWVGPDPGQVADERKSTRRWDVDLQIHGRAPRRGEEVSVDMTIGRPSADRGAIRVGLVCDIHYDVESRSTDSDGHTTTSRATKIARADERWFDADPSAPLQQHRFAIPADAPFSYGRGKAKRLGPFTMSRLGNRGNALAIEWKLVASEDRRLRRDPGSEIEVNVRP